MNPLEHPGLVPILQPANWSEREVMVTRCLSGSPVVKPTMPLIVSYGVVEEGATEFVAMESLEQLDNGLVDLDQRAKKNWVRLAAGQRWTEMDGLAARLLVWEGQGESGSSALLFPPVLASAKSKLQAEHFYVASPNRNTLIASDDLETLSAVAISLYDDSRREGGPLLSPAVLRIESGRVVGPARLASQAEATRVENALDRAPIEERIARALAATLVLIGSRDGAVGSGEVRTFLETVQAMRDQSEWHADIARGIDRVADHAEETLGSLSTLERDPASLLLSIHETCLAFDAAHGQDDGDALRAVIYAVAEQTASGPIERDTDKDASIEPREKRMLRALEAALQPSIEPPWTRDRSVMNEGETRVLVCVLSCDREEDLERAVACEMEVWTIDDSTFDGMDGEVRLQVDPDRFSITDATRSRLAELVARTNEQAERLGLKTPDGRRIHVTGQFSAVGK